MGIQITKQSETSEGLTLGDLFQFVQEADAAGIDPRHIVLVRVGFKAQIKKITVGGKL